jgi:poly-gamma-glutamate synthesis protein (capsule biosynthesis protein)
VRWLRTTIERWRTPGSIIVCSVHWGPNWGFEISPEHRRFAHRLIDEAGVHVVHGHSSHHVKGIEVHAGHPIFYGCGDLLTDYEGIRSNEPFRGDLGLLYFVTLDAAGVLTRLEMVPMQVRRFRLSTPAASDAQWLAAVLARTGESLGTSVATEGTRLVLSW